MYCQQRGQVPLQPTVIAVLQFLTLLYEEGKGYSSLNVARCVISTLFLGKDTVSSHHLISKCFRGVFNRRPALPRNNVTWDADAVLTFLKTWVPAKRLSLRQLTLKVTVLLLLLSGQRGQTIWLLDTRNITLSKNEVRRRIGDLIKTSNPKNHVDEVTFAAYPPDRRLCVVTYVKAYLNRTALLRRKESGFLISFKKPHNKVSRDTIRRWVKAILELSGVDTSIFTPHSTRAASTRKAATNIPLKTILKTAGWRRRSTFATYYNKPVIRKGVFATAFVQPRN